MPKKKWLRIEAVLYCTELYSVHVAQRLVGETMSLKATLRVSQSIASKLHAIQLAIPCVSLYLGSMHAAITTAVALITIVIHGTSRLAYTAAAA